MTVKAIKQKLEEAAHLGTWGPAWGKVGPPKGSKEQAPLDAAFLAPFEERPVLVSIELFNLVREKFANLWDGVAAPIDIARVEGWKKNAIARGLVEENANHVLRLTNRGEDRLRALQSGGVTTILKTRWLTTTLSHIWAALVGAGIATSALLGEWSVLLGIVIAVGFVAGLCLYRIGDRSLKPLEQRHHEIAELTAEERESLAAANGLTVDDLPPSAIGSPPGS